MKKIKKKRAKKGKHVYNRLQPLNTQLFRGLLIFLWETTLIFTMVNKEELVQSVSKKTNASQKQVSEILAAILESIESSVAQDNKVTLVGFGTFEPRSRAERTGRNPQTGAEIKIAAKKVPAFTAGKKFKDLVAGNTAKTAKKVLAKKK
jgi:DNA-binding protein HU-beta